MNAETARSSRFAQFARDALPRGLALFLGGFALLNLLGDLRSARFDANSWWIDLRLLPDSLARLVLLVSAACVLGFGIRPPRSTWRQFLTAGCLVALLAGGLANVIQFYILLARHTVTTAVPVPLSLITSGALALVLGAVLRPYWLRVEPGKLAPAMAIVVICALVFPLAEMLLFGKTDYRRPADIAVVLGARVYADGRPSDALADRVRTGCQLYREGLVKTLLFSGGPGDGPVHETEAMKRMALQLGVPAEDILVDEAGVNTQATVRNSEAIFSRLHAKRILVVSHFYHLPRVKMAYHRAGWEVYTVPAKESYLLRQMPYNMAREVAALWVYYLRPLMASG